MNDITSATNAVLKKPTVGDRERKKTQKFHQHSFKSTSATGIGTKWIEKKKEFGNSYKNMKMNVTNTDSPLIIRDTSGDTTMRHYHFSPVSYRKRTVTS